MNQNLPGAENRILTIALGLLLSFVCSSLPVLAQEEHPEGCGALMEKELWPHPVPGPLKGADVPGEVARAGEVVAEPVNLVLRELIFRNLDGKHVLLVAQVPAHPQPVVLLAPRLPHLDDDLEAKRPVAVNTHRSLFNQLHQLFRDGQVLFAGEVKVARNQVVQVDDRSGTFHETEEQFLIRRAKAKPANQVEHFLKLIQARQEFVGARTEREVPALYREFHNSLSDEEQSFFIEGRKAHRALLERRLSLARKTLERLGLTAKVIDLKMTYGTFTGHVKTEESLNFMIECLSDMDSQCARQHQRLSQIVASLYDHFGVDQVFEKTIHWVLSDDPRAQEILRNGVFEEVSKSLSYLFAEDFLSDVLFIYRQSSSPDEVDLQIRSLEMFVEAVAQSKAE